MRNLNNVHFHLNERAKSRNLDNFAATATLLAEKRDLDVQKNAESWIEMLLIDRAGEKFPLQISLTHTKPTISMCTHARL